MIGSRGSGKSAMLATISSMNTILFDHCETLIAGAIDEQAKKIYGYFLKFARQPVFSSLFNERKALKDSVEFKNESFVSVVPGTMERFNGPHPHKLLIDELELFNPVVLAEGSYMVKGSEGIPGQTIYTTSRKFPWGIAENMMHQIESGTSNVTLWIWCCFDTLEQCKEESCLPCKRKIRTDGKSFYDICKLREGRTGENSNGQDIMRAKISRGHYPLKTLWDGFQSVTTEPKSFDSQHLSMEPSRDTLVYGMLDEKVHKKPHEYFQELLKDEHRPITVDMAIDLGFVDPTVVLFYVIRNGRILVLDEIYEPGLLQPEILERVQDICRKNQWKMGQAVVDPSSRGGLEIYKRVGFDVVEAENKIDLGITETQGALRHYPEVGDVPAIEPGLIFSDRCVNTWRDMVEYHWSTKNPTELSEAQRKKPAIHQSDHGADCVRYIVMNTFHDAATVTVNPRTNIDPISNFSWSSGFSEDEGGFI